MVAALVAAAAGFVTVMGDRTIVLRWFGKYHGLAGAQLVFVVANSELVARLRRWIVGRPVGTDANAMGIDF